MSLYKRGLSTGSAPQVLTGASEASQDLGVGAALSLGVVGFLVVAVMSKNRSGGGGGGFAHPPRRRYTIGTHRSRQHLGGDMRALLAQREYDL